MTHNLKFTSIEYNVISYDLFVKQWGMGKIIYQNNIISYSVIENIICLELCNILNKKKIKTKKVQFRRFCVGVGWFKEKFHY